MGLVEYLSYVVGALEKLGDFPAVHIVLCNEACDLDSAVSAITYAYYLHETSSLPVGTAIYLPLLNIPRYQFPLRTEVVFLLSKYNITDQHLLFTTDLDLLDVKAKTDLKVTLVDHHVLSEATTYLQECVVQVIDHRPAGGSLPDKCEITIEPVGSCSTLVAEALLNDETFSLDAVTATLLYGAIITDTINFSPSAGKTTQKDLDIGKELEEVIGQGLDRESLFQEIKRAKFDLSGLSSMEMLQKDLKLVSGDSLKVAMCSISISMTDLLCREDLLQSLKDFVVELDAEAVVLMTVDMQDEDHISRQLAVFSPSRVYRQQMADVLTASQSPNLGLSPMACPFEDLLPFHQANIVASRKQVLPIVKGFLAGETTPDENQLDSNLHCASEGFTSLTLVGGSRQDTFDGAITSEELMSRNISTEGEVSSPDMEDTNLLSLPGVGKTKRVFDPLSSVHSSDGVPSPTDFTTLVGANKEDYSAASNDDCVFKCNVSTDNPDVTLSAYNDAASDDFFSRKIDEDADIDPVLAQRISPNGELAEESTGNKSAFSAFSHSQAVSSTGWTETVEKKGEFDAAGDRTFDKSQAHDFSFVLQHAELKESEATREEVERSRETIGSSAPSSQGTGGGSSGPSSQGTGSYDSSSPITQTSPQSHFGDDPPPAQVSFIGNSTSLGILQELASPSLAQEGDRSFNHERESDVPGSVEDFLEMASPHDLLFPTSDSPFDLSAVPSGAGSGQTSGQASTAPSYPVTPPNSYMEGGLVEKEVHLPSFNSSEMMEKIQEKKASLPKFNLDPDLDPDPDPSSHPLSPFTPHNSYVESAMRDFPRETHLPSFHSSDMVQRIRDKRSSMERDILGHGAEGDDPDGSLLEVTAAPFTPHNSYVESSGMAGYVNQHHLPSLNNAEMAERIRQRQAELVAAAGQTSDTAGLKLSSDPTYTPQNSYRDVTLSNLAYHSHRLDMNEVAERLSLSGSESSGSLSEPKAIKVSNKLHASSSSSSVAGSDAVRFQMWEREDGTSSMGDDEEERDSKGRREEVNGEIRTAPAMGVKRNGAGFTTQTAPVVHLYARESTEEDLTGDEMSEEAMEEAILRVAYQLANEMIQKALDTFPAPSVKSLVDAEVEQSSEVFAESETEAAGSSLVHQSGINDGSSPSMDESDRDLSSPGNVGFSSDPTPESSPDREDSRLPTGGRIGKKSGPVKRVVRTSASLAEELAQAVKFADQVDTRSYEIETEYLSEMAPMQLPHSPEATHIIETDADKEVVESSSFRKISGQECQTVQEEIMEQIRQEARQRKMSKVQPPSVAEELNESSAELATSSEDKGSATTGSWDQTTGAGESLETKKRISPADVDIDSPDDEDAEREAGGKRTIHAIRDKELYASALDNQAEEETDLELVQQQVVASCQQAVPSTSPFQPAADFPHSGSDPYLPSGMPRLLPDSMDSSASHPLMAEEQSPGVITRKKIPAHSSQDPSPVEEHRYDSFEDMVGAAEAALGKEEESRQKSVQGGNSAGKPSVGRSVSAASDVSTGGGRLGLSGTEIQDEWQDDEMPHPLAEDGRLTLPSSDSRKRLVPEGLSRGEDNLDNVPVLDSESDIDSNMDNDQLEWENDTPVRPTGQVEVTREEIQTYSASDEFRDAHAWKIIDIGAGETFRLDLRVIEPYKRVLSHGGYYGDGLNAVIVFSACYLPSRDRVDYPYVMDHLFQFVIHTMEELVADNYMVVYFHGATPRRQMPSLGWLRRCYRGIDRRLKKNLKALYLVHPTLWLKTVVLMTRPFISAKFSSKLQFVRTLNDLKRLVPMDFIFVPDMVQRLDEKLRTRPSVAHHGHAQDQAEGEEMEVVQRVGNNSSS